MLNPINDAQPPAKPNSDEPDTAFSFQLPPGEKQRLVEKIGDSVHPSIAAVRSSVSAFQERFPVERLARLQGAELLVDMHGSSPGGNITRNSTGHLQVDPLRFPGGNEGFKNDSIRI